MLPSWLRGLTGIDVLTSPPAQVPPRSTHVSLDDSSFKYQISAGHQQFYQHSAFKAEALEVESEKRRRDDDVGSMLGEQTNSPQLPVDARRRLHPCLP